MANFEKHRSMISKIMAQSNEATPGIRNGKLVMCEDISCSECDLQGEECICGFIGWLYEDDGETSVDMRGCNSCRYSDKTSDENPCIECSRFYSDMFEYKPKKTRQSEFLKMYPNARMLNGVIDICPKHVDGNCDRCRIYAKRPCIECHKDYWLQEVEE